MKISIDDFSEKNFIGDWILDHDIFIDKETILEELKLISENEDEFDFSIYDGMREASFREIDEDIIEKEIQKNFKLEELKHRLREIIKK